MKIEKVYYPENDTHEFRIKFTGQYLCSNCDSYPFKHLINEGQALGIIEDSILLACGFQLKQKSSNLNHLEGEDGI